MPKYPTAKQNLDWLFPKCPEQEQTIRIQGTLELPLDLVDSYYRGEVIPVQRCPFLVARDAGSGFTPFRVG